MKIILAAITLALTASPLLSQNSFNAANILHRMHKLGEAGCVLYIAAHPDDENTRLLSYLSNEKKIKTVYLSLTRGEGGQNLIGKEIGPGLGVLRTQELLAARSIDGAEQYFSRAADFGYSKSPEETFKFWNKDSVLSDMVLVIRKLKPDVIICRFPATGEGGHGHHTASAILAAEAFEAAANPKRFKWQLNSYTTWNAGRLYWNTFNFSRSSTIGPGQFSVDVGGYNQVMGKSYGEIASASRSMHKSQGFGTVLQRGTLTEHFKLLSGDSTGTDLFSSMDFSLSRFDAFSKVHKLINDCIETYDASAPYLSVEKLSAIYKSLDAVKSKNADVLHWKNLKKEECADLILLCAGLYLEATSPEPYAVSGEKIEVLATALNRTPVKAKLVQVAASWQAADVQKELLANVTQSISLNTVLPADAIVSQPFWLKENGAAELTDFNRSKYAGSRAMPPALTVEFTIEINGIELKVEKQLIHKKADPASGEVRVPVYILPPVEVEIGQDVVIFNAGEKKNIGFRIIALTDSISGRITVNVPAGWKAAVSDTEFSIAGKDGVFQSVASVENLSATTGTFGVTVQIGAQTYDRSLRWIDHDHIPRQVMSEKAVAALVQPDLKKGINTIAYIPGAGDEVAESLTAAGYKVTLLTTEQISRQQLSKYDAVVTGIRAFNVNKELHKKMDVLLDYVKEGGNLIVQYNTNSWAGPLAFVPGPYPYKISRLRTTDENASVDFLMPDHPALTVPNHIEAEDFANWVQERGIYFGIDANERYQKPLSMADPGEKALDGSLLIARYGKGNFVYTGLAFFRQLPAGVPGAYKLFANLLSLPQENK